MKIILAILFLTIEFSYSQTCIIVAKRHDSLFVGADTREGYKFYEYGSNKLLIDRLDTVCKIHKFQNIYFSLAGADPENLYAQMAQSCKNKNTLAEIADDFRKKGKSMRIKYLQGWKDTNYVEYKNRFNEFRELQAVFMVLKMVWQKYLE